MAEPVRTFDPGPTAPSLRRPRLEIVGIDPVPTDGTDHAPHEEAAIGGSAMISAAIGFFVVTIGITVAGTLGGIGFASSLGLGAFVGAFGGAGFGFMMGATIPLARRLDGRRPARSTLHGRGEPHVPEAR